MKTYVYGLREHNSDEYRYIGITSKDPQIRLKEHLADDVNHFKNAWILSCQYRMVQIEVDTIYTCSTRAQALAIEAQLIDYLVKKEGHRLTNIEHNPVTPDEPPRALRFMQESAKTADDIGRIIRRMT